MSRLPVPGSDNNAWGTILNDFLSVTLDTDGLPKNIGVIAAKYVKPPAGIPESDLDVAVQVKLNAGEVVQLLVTNPNGAVLTTGNGQAYIVIPSKLDTWQLMAAAAAVTTVSSSGNITIQIAKVSPTVDMLSTPITIEASQSSSYTAGTQPVVNPAQAQVAEGNILQVDVDTAGTNAKGLIVVLEFQKV